MDTITWTDKSIGDQLTAADINEIKSVVNANAADTWDDIVVPILTATKSTGNPPVDIDYLGGKLWGFDVNDVCYFNLQLPHGYKEGSDVEIHFHFIPSAAQGATAANAQFTFTYAWANIGAEFPAISSQLTAEYSLQNVSADDNLLLDLGDMTGTGKTISSILICSLKRVAATSAEYSGTINISSIDAHFQRDTLGSLQETSKT